MYAMPKRRLLSSVATAVTMVGACLFLAPTAQAADGSCTGSAGAWGLPGSCTSGDGKTTCTITATKKFPFVPIVTCSTTSM